MKNRIINLSLIAVLLIVFTVACIKWPSKSKPLGEEYSSHIYIRDTYRQFYIFDGVGLGIAYDDLYDCEWNFVYNDSAKAYEIYCLIDDDNPLYITLNSDNELRLSLSCDEYSDYWKSSYWRIEKIGNTQFYSIVNLAQGYALCAPDDNPDWVGITSFDENDSTTWMRLQ